MLKKMILCKVIAILIICAGCTAIQNANEEIPIMKAEGSYEVFESIEELTHRSTDIVEVRVTNDQQTLVVEDTPVTITGVDVIDVMQGNLKKNQMIYVQEVGGVFHPYLSGDLSNEKQEHKVELAFEGVRVMQPGDRHVLFLNQMNVEDALADGAYYVLGLFQGRYKWEDNKYVKEGPNFNPEQFTAETRSGLKQQIERVKYE